MQLPIITGLYAGLATFLVIALTLNVVRHRRLARVGIGDGNNEPLRLAIRLHGNALEYIPLSLFLMSLVEMQSGLSAVGLHLVGLLLLSGRLLHIIGLQQSLGTSFGRRYGIIITLLVLLFLAIINILLFIYSL